ncbi:MAG: DUF1553 domain-containing protein [Planctomycetes bacterium]|nr:DUF1553 domain-containing protein [Planctomycetota bacterium]
MPITSPSHYLPTQRLFVGTMLGAPFATLAWIRIFANSFRVRSKKLTCLFHDIMRLAVTICLVYTMTYATILPTSAAPAVDFVRDIAPIFEQHCVSCHKSSDPNGDLDLTYAEGVLNDNDLPLVVVENPAESLLLKMISGDQPEMPQDANPLSAEQVATIKRWIEQGAPWPAETLLVDKNVVDTDWWSFKPLNKPAVPQLHESDSVWVRTPIDTFVLSMLRERGLSPSPEADRRTLLRRLYFDLVGLPPTPEESDAFVKDTNPQAYEQLVERLLASKHYGERWARHWLDIVHYGDTHGFDKDKVRNNAWPYRDYVIRAFNDDKPYDRFVREQLAGDAFYPNETDGIVALGFIAAGPFDWVGQIEVGAGTLEKKRVRNLDRDDMVRNTIETFCSATVGCARCHDHKFDPFTAIDYYSLQAVFATVDRADRQYAVDSAVEARRASLSETRKDLSSQIKANNDSKERNDEQLSDLQKSLEAVDVQLKALPKQKYVFAATTSFAGQGQFQPTQGKPRPVHLLQRGSVSSPLQQVEPGTIQCLSHLKSYFPPNTLFATGANRAALADWILDEQNPLTWRSIVNRVWQFHFGRGLVDTASDFGRMGTLPTHPQLLDWLAVTFRDEGRSIKNLHRLIVNSATYRQSSNHNEHHAKIDRSNQYLWRMNRRRLDAESLRDAMLVVAGEMDFKMYGPGFRAFGFEDDHSPRYKYEEYDPNDPASHRRTIYRFIVRSAPDPFMETLDCADPSMLVARRNETLTPLQALALLNNHFVVTMAEHFAQQINKPSDSTADQIARATRLAFGREPTPQETQILTDIANKHGLPNACRLIFNTNEFLFID